MNGAHDRRGLGIASGGVALIAAVALLVRLRATLPLEGAVGVDGWYYAVQVRALLDGGSLALPALPGAYLWLAPFAAIGGPVIGTKVGAAVAGALAAIPCFALGRRVGGSESAGLLSAVVGTLSVGACSLTFEFVQNGVAVVAALGATAALLHAQTDRRGGTVAAAVALAAVACLTHKIGAALVLALCVPVLAASAGRVTRAALAALVALAACAALSLVDTTMQWRPSAWTWAALRTPERTLWCGHEAALAAGGVVVAAALALHLRRRAVAGPCTGAGERALVVAAGAVALVIACPAWDVGHGDALGLRVRLLAYVPLALLLAWCAGAAGRRRGPRRPWIAPLIVAAAWAAVPKEPRELLVATPPSTQRAAAALTALPPGAVVICPARQIVFLARWAANVDARLRADDAVTTERRWRLLPRAFVRRPSREPLAAAIAAALRERPDVRALDDTDALGLVLLPEAAWLELVRQLPPPVRDEVTAWPTY